MKKYVEEAIQKLKTVDRLAKIDSIHEKFQLLYTRVNDFNSTVIEAAAIRRLTHKQALDEFKAEFEIQLSNLERSVLKDFNEIEKGV